MSAGNIQAIGDWYRATRYLKTEIDEFFIQNNEYTAYLITIKDVKYRTVTLTGQTSGLTYSFKMIEANMTKLLFFTSGETVVATDGTYTVNKTLTDRETTIKLTPLKYEFDQNYQKNTDYVITSAADIYDFVEEIITVYHTYYRNEKSTEKWRAEVDKLKNSIPEIKEYVRSLNTNNSIGITIEFNAYYDNPNMSFAFVGPITIPNGVSHIQGVYTNNNYRYCEVTWNEGHNPPYCKFPETKTGGKVQTNYSSNNAYLTYTDGYSAGGSNTIGIYTGSALVRGCNMGIHY